MYPATLGYGYGTIFLRRAVWISPLFKRCKFVGKSAPNERHPKHKREHATGFRDGTATAAAAEGR